jgi:hypothetical protein
MKVGDWSFVIADVCPQKHSAGHSLKRKKLGQQPGGGVLESFEKRG